MEKMAVLRLQLPTEEAMIEMQALFVENKGPFKVLAAEQALRKLGMQLLHRYYNRFWVSFDQAWQVGIGSLEAKRNKLRKKRRRKRITIHIQEEITLDNS